MENTKNTANSGGNGAKLEAVAKVGSVAKHNEIRVVRRFEIGA